jgi:hypothetical protein
MILLIPGLYTNTLSFPLCRPVYTKNDFLSNDTKLGVVRHKICIVQLKIGLCNTKLGRATQNSVVRRNIQSCDTILG